MAQALPALNAAAQRRIIDAAGFAVNAAVRVKWSDPHSQGVVASEGTILERAGSLANNDLALRVLYPFGTFPLPPTNNDIIVYEIQLMMGGQSMGAAMQRQATGGTLVISHTNPLSWSVFIAVPRGVEEAAVPLWQARSLTDFNTWMRGRHLIPSADRLAAAPSGGPWANMFEFHRHNGILRALSLWVRAAQRNSQWQDPDNVALAEELVIEAETFLNRDSARRLHQEIAKQEAGGRIGKAMAAARSKKDGGGSE